MSEATQSFRWANFSRVIHNAYTAWVILLLSLAVTLGAYFLSERFVQQRVQDRFVYHSEQLEEAIINHIHVYEQVLRGAAAFMHASRDVSRQEFREYVNRLELDRYWPGIQGIGLAVPVPSDELEAHIEKI